MNNIPLLLLLVALCIYGEANAVQYPRPLAGDPRIKTINYEANAIHVYTGYYGYQSSIVFEDGENIEMISMGDSTAWQMIPQANRLMLKPIDADASTNVTIISNFRVYHFEFHADHAKGLDDPDLSYEVRFNYPSTASLGSGSSSGSTGIGTVTDYSDIFIPDVVADFASLNFRYTISGSERIAPILAFDDGEFTYIKYADNAEIPAAFLVNEDGYESLINFKSKDGYMVIEKISGVFTLRYGSEIACLFNESIPFHKNKTKKRKAGIFGKHYQQ